MSLPVKTTLEDVRTITAYFKTKPAGATIADAKAVLGGPPLDGRKLKAYTQWDILSVDGDRYKLTDKGRRFSRAPEAESAVLQEVVNSIPAYRSAVEWGFHQQFTDITVDELAANWHEHHRDAVGSDNEGSIKGMVTCFFSLASGAGLGRYVVGRSGQPTRLELDRTAAQAMVEAGPSAPPWQDPAVEEPEEASEAAVEEPAQQTPVQEQPAKGFPPNPPQETQQPVQSAQPEELRVFITHGKNMDIVDQVKTTLEIAGIQAEVAVEEESTAIPVPDKVFGAMRNCNAGIICVSAEEDAEGGLLALNQNVLIEIGAAFVLYDKKVVLLWDKRLPVPSNLQGLYRCDYEGSELSWTTGMKLMKAIQGFKNAA